MSGPDDLPESGWYPDPHEPSRVRYWDGDEWSDHYAPAPPPGGARFTDIGTWLRNSFRAIGVDGLPALVFAFISAAIVTTLFWVLMRWAIADVVYDDEELFAEWSTVAWRLALAVSIAVLAEGFAFLVLNRFMQRAHMGAEPSLPEAVRHAATRMGAWVRATLTILAGAAVALVAFTAALQGTPADVWFLLLFVLLVVAVWLYVKLMFLAAAIVAAPPGTPAIRSSADVSKGNFWAVLGRFLLLSLILGFAASIWDGAFSAFDQPFDDAQLLELEASDRLRVGDIMASFPNFVPAVIFGAVAAAFTSLITSSAYMRLYLDSGAPVEPLEMSID